MNKKNYNKNKKQYKYNNEISIPLFLPLIIVILFIIFFLKICNINVNASTNSNVNISESIAKEENIEEANKETNDVIEEENESNANETNEQKTNVITYTASNGEQYTIIATLKIPSLEIEYPILSSTSTELLKISLNKYWGANPNEVGNMVVLGHNYKNDKFFGKLPNIQIGEIVKITDLTGKTLDYTVYDTYVIDPYDNACTSQLTDGKTEITLITCYYEAGQAHATKRFVVKARTD